jgi:tetratricopeptide (TPR) repeat protein
MKLNGGFAALVTATFVFFTPSASHAAWCANYVTSGTNCGFSSFQSCQAAVSGIGGNCYQAADEGGRSKPARKRERRKATSKQTAPQKETARPAPAPPQPSTAAPSSPPASAPTSAPVPVQQQPQGSASFAGARQLVLNGQYEAGLAALRRLQFDDHPDVAAFAGLASRKLGRVEDARNWYQRALAADPNHKLALSFYGILRAETGDLANARADLERLKQICGDTSCNEYQALAAVIERSPR